MKVEFKKSSDNKQCQCYMTYDNNITVCGSATCHEDDADMCSERTGCYIAEQRAMIQILRFKRDHEIKPALAALKHLKDCVYNSPKCDPNSNEYKAIKRQVFLWEQELAGIKLEIKDRRKDLKEYIDTKDKLYKRIREKANNN